MNTELENLINTLSINSFRKLIKEYVKEKYSTPNVRITDGPYDGGNDLEIVKGDKTIKKNIQVTVQKVFENKLEEDIKKASENAKKHNYVKSLDFYISSSVTKSKRDNYQTSSEIDYGVNLNIIDARILSEEAENYPSINRVTYEAHGLISSNTGPKEISKNEKILFDVLTLDRNTVEIKKNLINSLVFSFLFEHPDSTLDDISKAINKSLNDGVDTEFLLKELNYLKSKKQLISYSKGTFRLADSKKDELNIIYENSLLEEKKLLKILEDFLVDYNIKCDINDLLGSIQKIYDENYEVDIAELAKSNNSFSSSIRKSFNDLVTYFLKNGCSEKDANAATKELLSRLSKNDYLNKVSTTRLFANLYSSDTLDSYINERDASVVLDTQILIRILGILFRDNFTYKDYALRSVKSLLNTFKTNNERIYLITTFDYVEEVAGHIQEALKLQRFLGLPFIDGIGNSKNVYYNIYRRFQETNVVDDDTSFEEFISDLLDIDLPEYHSSNFIRVVTERLEEIFEAYGIEVIHHPLYDDYQEVKKAYEMSLAYAGRERSYAAREHDLRTMLYLSSRENHTIHATGEVNEPFLVTWDSAFYEFRKELSRKFKKKLDPGYWYIYSPLKFIDRFSVMNFKVDPSALTYNVIALAESNFNYSTKTISFFDVISSLFNVEDISQLDIIHKLTRLKNSTQEMDYVETEDTIRDSSESPVTSVLLELRNYYASFESKHNLSDLIKVFENNSFQDQIINIIEEAIKAFRPNRDTKKVLKKFDSLIDENAR